MASSTSSCSESKREVYLSYSKTSKAPNKITDFSCNPIGSDYYLQATCEILKKKKFCFSISLFTLLFSVVGDAKDIDWYAPSGEKILPNRADIFVSRSDEATSTLTIYHATVDSAGIYKCVAKDGDKEAQATVQVKIFRKYDLVLQSLQTLPVKSVIFSHVGSQHYCINCSNSATINALFE